jgi:hypothetical protein
MALILNAAGKAQTSANLHSAMTHEQPRILFFHYWGRGPAKHLADSVKGALLVTQLSEITTNAKK